MSNHINNLTNPQIEPYLDILVRFICLNAIMLTIQDLQSRGNVIQRKNALNPPSIFATVSDQILHIIREKLQFPSKLFSSNHMQSTLFIHFTFRVQSSIILTVRQQYQINYYFHSIFVQKLIWIFDLKKSKKK